MTAELLKDVEYPKPDELFDRDRRVDLGGVHARLMWRGPAEMHTRKEQPFSPVHSPQLKVLPGHFKVRIGFRLMNGAREVLQRTLQSCQQF